MACVEITNGDSEMEEGEIVDDVDELSDISSEEEFLLRQRLQVLENYNNVLERKQAKRTSNSSSNVVSNGKRPKKETVILCDLSEVSENDFEDNNINKPQKCIKNNELMKSNKRKKQTKEPTKVLKKTKDCKKKTKQDKKKSVHKIYIKSSDDSDDDYFHKRRKLADAVSLKKAKNDTTTLKDRINRMLFGTKKPSNIIELKHPVTLAARIDFDSKISDVNIVKDNNLKEDKIEPVIVIQNSESNNSEVINIEPDNEQPNDTKLNEENLSVTPIVIQSNKSINLCTDNESSQDAVDSGVCEKVMSSKNGINESKSDVSSDEDLELLREYALKTKSSKVKNKTPNEEIASTANNKPPIASEDEDSDTAELRLICLKSTLLKKAIEIKQKQKLKKRLSQSSCLQDDLSLQEDVINGRSENNTDIESVDMDIGSDGEEKAKETSKMDSKSKNNLCNNVHANHQDNELEEDEDLLRAKLLTSLSKNLPNLVDLSVLNLNDEKLKIVKKDEVTRVPVNIPEEKKFIIKLGESDSEGEHEETKNLTKMHMKLAEHYQDFQSKLDTLLKSTRQEFEKESLTDEIVQKPPLQKPAQKFVPKTMNHLPKSEQVEYKNLVKRMAELEKIKQVRNTLISSQNKTVKETLKLRNTTTNTVKSASNLEEKFALSRKKIAEESAKILTLKEEAKKLTQKYKIVASELKNISTAINLNKRQQRAVHNNLQKIRLQHQLLLKGATYNLNTIHSSNRLSKVQKENNPSAKDTNYTSLLKSVKVSVVNDNSTSAVESRLSVQLDVTNNKKTIKIPKNPPKGRVVDIVPNPDPKIALSKSEQELDSCMAEEGGGSNGDNTAKVHVSVIVENSTKSNENDYKSPLAALGNTTWQEDPNAFLCPYEVGGSCRDPDCKYLHPKIPTHQ